MHIYGPAHLHGPQSASGPHGARPMQPPSKPDPSGSIRDEVEISDAARLAEQQDSEIRWDRVSAIRAQIAEGTYETDAKLDAALDRLLDEIG